MRHLISEWRSFHQKLTIFGKCQIMAELEEGYQNEENS